MKKKISAILCLAVCIILMLPSGVYAESGREVIAGGALFGAKINTDGALVVGLDKVSPQGNGCPKAPAYEGGIRMKDVIIEINGKQVVGGKTVTDEISGCSGSEITLKVRRGDSVKTLRITPIKDKDGKYRVGMWIRDEASGIGTVTYIIPETGEFAGLGHGICDGETGALLPIKRGVVSDAELIGIIKGQKGTPGELKGTIGSIKKGSLIKNTECGVYGIFANIPKELNEKMKVASKNEITEGKATVRCSASGKIEDYEIEISKLNKTDAVTKNFEITVTDPRLLDLTGGIVQGLSGSPIIQNGKLVGAVTHVKIADPTSGYGIFIENMLNTATPPIRKAS